MCTLLLWKREHARYPLIAAANRDEFLDRPSSGPQALATDPLIVGGRDEVAGGTWLAVNECGLFVALTNRRGVGKHDPTRRSRGLLVVEIARSRTFASALEAIATIDAPAYNPFVLLVADRDRAAAVHAGASATQTVDISDGAHAITNWELDASSPPKAARAFRAAQSVRFDVGRGVSDDAAAAAKRLHALLADHGNDGEGADPDSLCAHRPQDSYGTRSSTIVFLGADTAETRLFHAEGPPCKATLVEVSSLLHHETAAHPAKERNL